VTLILLSLTYLKISAAGHQAVAPLVAVAGISDSEVQFFLACSIGDEFIDNREDVFDRR